MRPVTFRARTMARLTGFLLALAAAQTAAADTLTVAWDPSPDSGVAGYIVYVGTQPGVYDTTFDVGSSLSFTYPDAAPGQRYYFSVAAYAPGPVTGVRSSEVSGVTGNERPVLVNPGGQISILGFPVSMQLNGRDPEGRPVTFGGMSLPPGLTVAPSTGFISGTPVTAGTFSVTVSVTDGDLSDARTFTWTIMQSTAPGAPSPSSNNAFPAVPTSPTQTPVSSMDSSPTLASPGAQVGMLGAVVRLQLSASDPEGARLTYGASGLPPGLQIAPGTGLISGSPLAAGSYLVTALVTDGSTSDAKTFGWTIVQSATGSATAPVISITLSERTSIFSRDRLFLTLGGSATDDGRVISVEWSTDSGGQGTATGTDNWIAAIPLRLGRNVVTVRALDDAGNTTTKSVLIAGSTPVEPKPPTVFRTGPKSKLKK